MAKPTKDKILQAADKLRDMLNSYQREVGVEAAQALGDELAPLAFDIEAVLSGLEQVCGSVKRAAPHIYEERMG